MGGGVAESIEVAMVGLIGSILEVEGESGQRMFDKRHWTIRPNDLISTAKGARSTKCVGQCRLY